MWSENLVYPENGTGNWKLRDNSFFLNENIVPFNIDHQAYRLTQGFVQILVDDLAIN
jgi:hypothetical protein